MATPSKALVLLCLTPLWSLWAGLPRIKPESDRVLAWKQDLDYLTSEIKRRHYIYRSKPLPVSYLRDETLLRSRLGQLSDTRIRFEVLRLMADLGDGHCYVLPHLLDNGMLPALPVKVYFFSDGLFITDGPNDLIGGKVRKFGGLRADQLLASSAKFIGRDNDMGIKWIAPMFLRYPDMLEALGGSCPGGSVALEIVDRKGRAQTVSLRAEDRSRVPGPPKLFPSRLADAVSAPLYLRRVSENFWFERVAEDTVYVQFNQVADSPSETIATFAAHLSKQLQSQAIRNLAIDVRHNNGGTQELLPPLISACGEFRKIHPDGKLYVIMGRNTFSAAQIFINKLSVQCRPTFVGEPSSSKPNFVGEESPFTLPNGKLQGSISTRYHETDPNDHRKWIAPDIPVSLSSKDYFANVDPCLEVLRKRK